MTINEEAIHHTLLGTLSLCTCCFSVIVSITPFSLLKILVSLISMFFVTIDYYFIYLFLKLGEAPILKLAVIDLFPLFGTMWDVPHVHHQSSIYVLIVKNCGPKFINLPALSSSYSMCSLFLLQVF